MLKQKINDIKKQIENNKISPVYLLFGEEAFCDAGAKEIATAIVPEKSRTFNLEYIDGKAGSAFDITGRILNYSLLGGQRAIVITNATFFAAKSNVPALLPRAAGLWVEGEKEKACNIFATILAAIGKSLEELYGAVLDNMEPKEWVETFGVEKSEVLLNFLKECREYCLEKGLKAAAAGAVSEAEKIENALRKLAPKTSVIITTPATDKRSRLFKLISDIGTVIDMSVNYGFKENELPAEVLRKVVAEQVEIAGKTIDAAAVELVAAKAGSSVRALWNEIEKIANYVGERKAITEGDVEDCFTDTKTAGRFDLSDAVGERHTIRMIEVMDDVLGGGGGSELAIVGELAACFRTLVAAREMVDELGNKWRASCNYPEFKSRIYPEILEKKTTAEEKGGKLFSWHPFRLYRVMRSASNYTSGELLRNIALVQEADVRLKSATIHRSPKVVVEELAFAVTGKGGKESERA